MFNNITDLLKNHDFGQVDAEGIIFKKLTDGQMHFMEILKTTKIQIEFDLFQDLSDYDLDENVVAIHGIQFSDRCFNPVISIPNFTTNEDRAIIFRHPKCIIEPMVMYVEAFVKPWPGDVISREQDPVIEPTYDACLEDWVLKDFRKTTDDKGKVRTNELFKDEPSIIKTVQQKRTALLGLNQVQPAYYPEGRIEF